MKGIGASVATTHKKIRTLDEGLGRPIDTLLAMADDYNLYDRSQVRNSLLIINTKIGQLSQLSLDNWPKEDPDQDYDPNKPNELRRPCELYWYFVNNEMESERVKIIDAICCVLNEAINIADHLQINFSGLVLHRWIQMIDSYVFWKKAPPTSEGCPDAQANIDKLKSDIANHVSDLKRQLIDRDKKSSATEGQLLFGPRFFFEQVKSKRYPCGSWYPFSSWDYFWIPMKNAIDEFETNGYVHDYQTQWDVFKDHMFWHLMVVRDAYAKTPLRNRWKGGPRSLVLKLSGAVGELSAYFGSCDDTRDYVLSHSLLEEMAKQLAYLGLHCLSMLSLLKKEGSSLDPYYGDIKLF